MSGISGLACTSVGVGSEGVEVEIGLCDVRHGNPILVTESDNDIHHP